MVVAARLGLEAEDSLKRAEDMYVSVNIHNDENKEKLASLESLPDSCMTSADALERQRADFEKMDVFSPQLIDGIMRKLRSFNDTTLRQEVKDDQKKMLKLVKRFWHCG